MEDEIDILDTRDEVRKLQDKVRKLGFQNEHLRSEHGRNGVIGNKILSRVSNENFIVDTDLQYQSLDEGDIIIINNEDFLDEQRWLYILPNSVSSNIPNNLQMWLRQDVDNNNDNEFQLMRRTLIHELEEIEQGLRQNSIDTRTFTRSKKRMSRPSVETMMESPMSGNWKKLLEWRTAEIESIEGIDDISLTLNSTFGSLVSESLHNVNFHTDKPVEFNKVFQRIASEPHLNVTSEPRHNIFLKTASDADEMCTTYQGLPEPDLNATLHKGSDLSSVNRQKSVDLNATFQLTTRSRSITPSGLNSTFTIQDGSGSNRSGHSVCCDNGGDDDQCSSASDSSFSSSNRLMNVGDIQNIARLQEESLKQVTSTPKHNRRREGVVPGLEDMPSPVLGDYHSDHSDHSSSADGRAKSSRSSLKSSPGGSPFGSTQVLTDVPENVPCNAVVGFPRRELKPIRAGTQEVPKPQMAVKPMEPVQAGRSRGTSGLRPPAMRSRGGIAATIRASSQVRGSNIPRPASRIPPPRIRDLQVVSEFEDFYIMGSWDVVPCTSTEDLLP